MFKCSKLLFALSLLGMICAALSGCRSGCYSLLLTAADIEELASTLGDDKKVAAFFSKRNFKLGSVDKPVLTLSDGYPLSLRTDETYWARLASSSPGCEQTFRVLRVSVRGYKDAYFESLVFVYRDQAPYFDQIQELSRLGYTSGPTLSPFNSSHLNYLNDRIGFILDHPRLKVRRMLLYRSEGRKPAVHLESFTLSKEPEANGNNTYFIALRVFDR